MKRIRILVILLFIIIFIISTFNIYKSLIDYKTADNIYKELQENYVVKYPLPEQPVDDIDDEPIPISVDFTALKDRNPDVVGWLYCPDTPINYPVVQGKDNNEYLRCDLEKNYIISGIIFVDYRNSKIGEDQNYILYGHHMKDDTMFGTLVNYKDQSYYEKHPIMYYLTPNENFIIELYAGIVVSRDSKIYEPHLNKTLFVDFLQNAKENSTFKSNTTLKNESKLITLSTCSYEYDNARYIVIGQLNKLNT